MPHGLTHSASLDPPISQSGLPPLCELETLYAAVQGNIADMADALGLPPVQLRKQLGLKGIHLRTSKTVSPAEWLSLLGAAVDKGLSSLELSKQLAVPRLQICAALTRDHELRGRWQAGRKNRQTEKARAYFQSQDLSSCFQAKPLPSLLNQKMCWFLIRRDKEWLVGYLKVQVREWARISMPEVVVSEEDVSLCAQMLLYSIRSRLFPAFKLVNSRGAFRRHIPGFSSLGRRICHFPLALTLLVNLTARSGT